MWTEISCLSSHVGRSELAGCPHKPSAVSLMERTTSVWGPATTVVSSDSWCGAQGWVGVSVNNYSWINVFRVCVYVILERKEKYCCLTELGFERGDACLQCFMSSRRQTLMIECCGKGRAALLRHLCVCSGNTLWLWCIKGLQFKLNTAVAEGL